MHKKLSYHQIIKEYLKENDKAKVFDIYDEVEKKKDNLPKSWKSIVRNRLIYRKDYIRKGDYWMLKD